MKCCEVSRDLLCFILLLESAVHAAQAHASAESDVFCSPLVFEPDQRSYCAINLRDLQREPTMAFRMEEFSVTARSSVPDAVLRVSPLRRADDVARALFDVSASEGTTITLDIAYFSNSQQVPIRNSGLTLSVLSSPATHMGPITCNVASDGLALRSTTTCSAALYDANNRFAVVRKNEVTFSEENNLGFFCFVSGGRDLVFNFTAVSSPDIAATCFSMQVVLVNSKNASTLKFPLVYPEFYPVASRSTLACSNESVPNACTLRAADEVGPVRLNLNHFRLVIFVLNEHAEAAEWVDSTEAFDVIIHSLVVPHTVSITWKPRVNNLINRGQLRVYTNAPDAKELKTSQEVWGSPFLFLSGTMPDASYVSLRGCKTSHIVSGGRTVCSIDLRNGVTGDVRHFRLSSTLGAGFDEMKYVSADSLPYTSAISFVYIAPIVESRSDDFITLFVNGRNSVKSPHRIKVFPLHMETRNDGDESRTHDAIIIALGLAFFGAIIGYGCFLAVRRSMRMNRILNERVLRISQREAVLEHRGHQPGVQVGTDTVQKESRHQESESD